MVDNISYEVLVPGTRHTRFQVLHILVAGVDSAVFFFILLYNHGLPPKYLYSGSIDPAPPLRPRVFLWGQWESPPRPFAVVVEKTKSRLARESGGSLRIVLFYLVPPTLAWDAINPRLGSAVNSK